MNSGLIVVEGPIGVGKTSLAKRLASSLQADLLLEQPEKNPFLPRFYRNRRDGALPVQLHFLLQRAQQMAELRQGDLFRPQVVADFFLDKDRLFAELNLDGDEFQLYSQLYERLAIDAPRPDLVIYLQAPVEVLLTRIQHRGHGYEAGIGREYLQLLTDAYTRFFHYYESAPLLIVNAASVNLVDGNEDYNHLVSRLWSIRSGRHYFNPKPWFQ